MAADQKQLTIANDDVRLLELSAASANRFDLPAFQYQTGLELLLDEVIVEGFSVLRKTHVAV